MLNAKWFEPRGISYWFVVIFRTKTKTKTKTKTNQNQDQRHKYHHLTMTLHLTLKMTTAQVVKTSVTNNSLSKGYPQPEDHDKPITSACLKTRNKF